MDDFSIFGGDFDSCLTHLTKIMKVYLMTDNMLIRHDNT